MRISQRLRSCCAVAAFGVVVCFARPAAAQEPVPPPTPALDSPPAVPQAASQTSPSLKPGEPEDKRAFGVLPNYRTAESAVPFRPLTAKEKFTISTKDSFDGPVFLTTVFFAGISQLEGSDNAIYGQGLKGLVHRYGINYADQVIGNYFPEAIVPTLFHTDPRYFRKGEGSIASRTFYAVSRIFVCKNNAGHWTFNVNEFVGNSLAALTASAYHPHQRTPGDMASEGTSFVISDTIGQVLKEFWPDVKHHFKK